MDHELKRKAVNQGAQENQTDGSTIRKGNIVPHQARKHRSTI